MISLLITLVALVPFLVKDDSQKYRAQVSQVDTVYVHIDSIIYPSSTGPIGVEIDTLLVIPWKVEGEK